MGDDVMIVRPQRGHRQFAAVVIGDCCNRVYSDPPLGLGGCVSFVRALNYRDLYGELKRLCAGESRLACPHDIRDGQDTCNPRVENELPHQCR